MKAANKNTIPITSESDILCAFRNLTSSYDERTLHKWINFFKKCMYYASSDYSNPMFLSLTYNAVKKSEQYPYEFLYIHKLMYQLNYRCCLLTDALTTFANSFSQTILTFKNNVRKASHAFPEQYTSLKTDRDYFSEFKHSVKTIEKRLYGEIFMTAFEHSKPFLFYNDRGFINTLTYPAVLFPAECLRITHELIGKYFLSEDYILQYFHDKGIRFPISLAEFLSRVDIK